MSAYLSCSLGALSIFGFLVYYFIWFNKKIWRDISHPVVNMVHGISECNPAYHKTLKNIPVVDLTNENAKSHIVRACMEVGFFKVINHGIPMEFLTHLEEESLRFFKLPQQQKENADPSTLFGYGQKNIGSNGDTGSLEYLLFNINPEFTPPNSTVPGISEKLWDHMNNYVHDVRKMTCRVLEMIADELKIGSSNKLSNMISDINSDSCFRVNYYPGNVEASSDQSLIGFGEHTDPQIMSVIRSNNATGLQISLGEDTWVSVSPDHTAFFFLVGDIFQVLTNGRFKSIKHRVLADSDKSRVSMIYFGGPIMDENIKPIVMNEGEESLYKEFTWIEYKNSAYKTKLSENRLSLFEKSADRPMDIS